MRWSSVEKMNKPAVTTAAPANPGAEEDLVTAAKSGDESAFETLFKRYQPGIFALALRYTRVREDAEDVVQQTFHKMFVYLNSFEGKSSFSTWLKRIAINEALMLLRRGRALREVLIDNSSAVETDAPRLDIPDSSPDPEANYLKREYLEVLSTAINELTLGLRTAIELRELAELSTRETARRLGVSVAAVKARIFHGRSKLRKTLRRLGITARGVQPLTVTRLANRSCSSVRRQSPRIASNVASRYELTGRADWKN
jgi:RNA polymerase sigma-70 factor, ECF subfamily